ncbi:MAG: FTR1 family protein [Gemmatimonadetes bacterium]|nr:FTR1 family protein [Gemmatimonadota bacterium]
MTGRRLAGLLLALALVGVGGGAAAQAAPRPLGPWLEEIARAVDGVEGAARAGRLEDARQSAWRIYLDDFEVLESTYGPAGSYGTPATADRIGGAEARFHALLRAGTPAEATALAASLRADLEALRARAGDVAASPRRGAPAEGSVARGLPSGPARTPEIVAILAVLDSAEAAYRAGRVSPALQGVERAYLEGIEPLEARLAPARVARIERLVHLHLRPGMTRGAAAPQVTRDFAALRDELLAADAVLRAGTPFWFGAANAFVILVREGLEAVLLIGALLAYLTAAGAGRRERRQIYAGVGAGVLATFLTWVIARTLVPLDGASRELVEGITGLVAVGVLLYVSHWLFQKTYIHDWKEYLRRHVGRAVSSGSAVAMAGLAFAAVYREGFETVLFYQAIVFDAGPTAVLAGLLPGAVLILGVGVAIIRMGVRLPLRRVFGVTNAILLYLALVLLGKGVYNLQEAGLFAPHPLAWVPDHGALRQVLGLYPITESLAAQALLLTALVVASAYYRRRLARQRTAAPAPPRLVTSR